MKKHVICLGDSNTHGYCPEPGGCADGVRFNEEERWTCLLQQKLGAEYLVVEEGLSNRTTCLDDPLQEGLSAVRFITPCLMSHEPVDLLIIMLGTNDCKDYLQLSAACIGLGMARLVKKAMDTACWSNGRPNILVVSPPHIGEEILDTPMVETMGRGCVAKSRELAHCYKEQCDLLGVRFMDAQALGCEFNRVDFMHLTKKGHATLAGALARAVPELL